MDTRFWTKEILYQNIDSLRSRIGILSNHVPIDAKSLAYRCIQNVTVEELPFPSNRICGILYKGNRSTSIALNTNRTSEMQNFDCMHELVHYFFHDIPDCQRICFDRKHYSRRIVQDSYIEWQANEGSAQFLVPYQDFIPRFSAMLDDKSSLQSFNAQEVLAEHYRVSSQVIRNRIDSLAFEIDQYREGIPMSNIMLLSRRQQVRWGYQPTAYNAICDFDIPWSLVIG